MCGPVRSGPVRQLHEGEDIGRRSCDSVVLSWCECRTADYRNSSSTANYPRVNAQPEDRKSVTKFEGFCEKLRHLRQHVGKSCKEPICMAWARDAEDGQLNEAETKRYARKARAGSASTTGSEHKWPTCGKVCRARIGLLSHLRTHRPVSTTD